MRGSDWRADPWTAGPEGNYRGLDLARDGTRLAAHRHDGEGGDIWLTDLSLGTTSRFTFDAPQENSSPIWSSDGSRIAFGSLRGGTGGKWGLYVKPSNGAGAEELLLEFPVQGNRTDPMSWSPDGRSVLFKVNDPKTSIDLWLLPVSGERKAIPLLNTPFFEEHGQISPDGKWLAYSSNETGQAEIYVRPFPAGDR